MIIIRKALLLLLLFSLPLFMTNIYAQNDDGNFASEGPRKVAVFDPEGKIGDDILQIVREEISSVLVNRREYSVLERQLINKVLEENKFQGEGLVDASEISAIGRLMGADYVFISTINPLNNNYYMSCKMIEVATARIEKQSTGATQSGIYDIIQTTQFVVRRLLGENVVQQTVTVPDKPNTTAVPTNDWRSQTSYNSTKPSTTVKSNQKSSVILSTDRGCNIYSNNNLISLRDADALMSENPEALRYFRSAQKKMGIGGILTSFGWVSIFGGILADLLILENEGEYTGVGTAIGGAAGFVMIIPGLCIKGSARKNARRAVDSYNYNSGSAVGYTPSSPPIKFEAGFLPSGNVGLVMKF